MLQPKRLTDALSVAPQLEPDDVVAAAAQGYRSLINNRPDGEADDQPASAAIETVARQAGLAYRYLPVVSGQLEDAQAQAFAAALETLPGPVLAFCRTGTRCASLWALQARGDADAVLATARVAGYDLTALRPRLGGNGGQ
jgi:sulfide:quinone oxidoreductase